MSSLVADKIRLFLSEQFLESFNETGDSASNMYIFIGRSISWGTGDNAPSSITDYRKTEAAAWDYMLGAKRITNTDITQVIPRVVWTSGTVYTQYDDEVTTLLNGSTSFYVMTSNRNVYKCIDNNAGAASTSEPSGTTTAITTTADSYRWKYMYTISEDDEWKFMDAQYIPWIPVKTLKSDPGSTDNYYNQWLVQQAAIDGGIHHIIIETADSGLDDYPNVTITGDGSGATARAIVTAGVLTSIQIVTPGTGYTWATVTLGSAESSSSSSSSTVVSVTSASSPSSESTVASVTSSSNSSSSSVEAKSSSSTLVDETSSSESTVLSVTSSSSPSSSSTLVSATSESSSSQVLVTSSSSSTIASETSTLSSPSSPSSSSSVTAVLRPVISPSGGHGSDPAKELGGFNILVAVDISEDEENTLPTNQDFRQIGIMLDPKEYDGVTDADNVNYKQTTTLTMSTVYDAAQNYVDDEVVYQGDSLATATATGRVVTWTPATAGAAGSTLTVTYTRGTWINEAPVHGTPTTSYVTGKSNVPGVTSPGLQPGSGHLLYLYDTSAIQRASDQSEQLRVILDF